MKQYKIGEVARLLGLSTQALRFYEQEGVIAPHKSENGTRYFTTAEIIRLLAFRKYQLSEFSVQDVAAHFQEGSLDSLIARLDAKSDALIAQSEMLLRRARAVRSFESTLREAKALEGQMACAESPEVFLQNLTFDQLSSLTREQREAFTAFADAMPESSMYFICPSDGRGEPEFRFGVSRQTAKTWALPLEGAIRTAPFRCVRVYVRTAGRLWDPENLHALLERVRAAGYAIDPARNLLGEHLASETLERVIHLYAVVWIPILD
ncbi:MAG: MerR family transcriptional regulator [Candidatus Ventricola sp.]